MLKGCERRFRVIVLVVVLCFSVSGRLLAGQKKAFVQTGSKPTWLERHSAEELGKYVQLLTGGKAKIIESNKLRKSRGLFLIGTVETNPAIKRLADAGQFDIKKIESNVDGFIIKSVNHNGNNVLVLCGNKERAVLYAVYDYLENDCGIGFFQDGEYIPSIVSMPTENIDRAEVSRRRRSVCRD